MKVKILPLTILTCSLFLAGKTFDLIGISHADNNSSAPAAASDDAKAPVADATSDDKKPAPAKTDSADAAKTTDAPPAAKADDSKPSDAKVDNKADAKDGKDAKDAKPKLPANVSYDRPAEDIPQFTDSEKQVLQKLADRRAELDAYANDLDMKASLLDATSKKVEAQLEELKTLKTDTEALLKTYNEHEDVKIRSLVKIYENMKPSAAAGIFEQLDMDTLLEIIDKMAEKKVSPILAAMDPKKAEEITRKLADEKSLRAVQESEAKAVVPEAAAQPATATPAQPPAADKPKS